MSPKEYLSQLDRCRKSVSRIESEIQEIRLLMSGIGTHGSSEGSNPNPGTSSPQERMIFKVLQLESELEAEKIEAVSVVDKICHQIRGLKHPVYSDILYERYVNCKRLQEIAKDLCYSYDWIREAHGLALLAFKKQYPEIGEMESES